MKVLVHFRGSIGDVCVWMPKLKGLFEKHDPKDIYFVLNSRYDFHTTSSLFDICPSFHNFKTSFPDHIKSIPYHMPAETKKVKEAFGEWDQLYNFDVWNKDKWNPPVSKMYTDLGFDTYPGIIPEKTNTVIIHPYGYNIKDTWTKLKWLELCQKYYNAGYKVEFMGGFIDKTLPIEELINLIRTACLWIGVDTGTRNLAMISKVPVIELGTPGKGDPNFDVFHPKEYRENSLYFPNIDKVTPQEIFDKSERFLNG